MAVVLMAAACAKQAPPSGGPVDDVAPRILSVYPDSFAVGVPRDTTLHLEFSEAIDGDVLDRAIWIAPQTVVIRKIERDGLTLRVKFREPLPESSTVSVLVGTGVADRRGNQLQRPVAWVFSTGDRVLPGRIDGRVERDPQSREARGERLLVGVYDAADSSLHPEERSPRALTQADAEGRFILEGLDTAWGEVGVVPFVDRNGNFVVDTRDEYLSARSETVTLSPQAPRHTLSLKLIDPDSPGLMAGAFRRAGTDSVTLGVELYEAAPPARPPAVATGRARPDGGYLVPGIPAGWYRLVAYCDANDNHFRDVLEPWIVWEDTLLVSPGDTTRVDTIQALDCGPER